MIVVTWVGSEGYPAWYPRQSRACLQRPKQNTSFAWMHFTTHKFQFVRNNRFFEPNQSTLGLQYGDILWTSNWYTEFNLETKQRKEKWNDSFLLRCLLPKTHHLMSPPINSDLCVITGSSNLTNRLLEFSTETFCELVIGTSNVTWRQREGKKIETILTSSPVT